MEEKKGGRYQESCGMGETRRVGWRVHSHFEWEELDRPPNLVFSPHPSILLYYLLFTISSSLGTCRTTSHALMGVRTHSRFVNQLPRLISSRSHITGPDVSVNAFYRPRTRFIRLNTASEKYSEYSNMTAIFRLNFRDSISISKIVYLLRHITPQGSKSRQTLQKKKAWLLDISSNPILPLYALCVEWGSEMKSMKLE